MPSSTILSGIFCIRVCITNHRTDFRDLDALCDAVKQIGLEVVRTSSCGSLSLQQDNDR
jgi:hypothetical protein